MCGASCSLHTDMGLLKTVTCPCSLPPSTNTHRATGDSTEKQLTRCSSGERSARPALLARDFFLRSTPRSSTSSRLMLRPLASSSRLSGGELSRRAGATCHERRWPRIVWMSGPR
ncbi:uncharacterized protein LOC134534140 [Bacillus rossius redtenbacheri]|uniref:uncharacterized protein LOC134534140 n=1 Tax=Bacillus rossius redtenbacheri TaxID=93214 RepID=UPI002FDDE64F